jgi:hypothetical protein
MKFVSKASFHRFDIVIQQNMMKEDASLILHGFVHQKPSPSKIAHFIGVLWFSFTMVIRIYTVKLRVKVKGKM